MEEDSNTFPTSPERSDAETHASNSEMVEMAPTAKPRSRPLPQPPAQPSAPYFTSPTSRPHANKSEMLETAPIPPPKPLRLRPLPPPPKPFRFSTILGLSGDSYAAPAVPTEAPYSGFDDGVRDVVKNIAMRMSVVLPPDAYAQAMEEGNPGVNPFDGQNLDADPRLDPNSDLFESKYWIRNMKRFLDTDLDHFKPTALGVAFKDLRAYGQSSDADYQATVLNAPFKIAVDAWNAVVNRNDHSNDFDILKPMDGLVKRGTVTVVLGRPGAGCTTFLKTIASQTHGFKVGSESVISYDGLSPDQIRKNYRGEVTYSAEADVHFPHLTVGQTLNFASGLRVPANRPHGISREEYASRITDVYMAMYGLSHTFNTPVGNETVRGVSGGERKRVSIAEVSLCGSYLQCWDNATRGLDSATALEFIRALKTQAEVMELTSLIAIYQCSQEAYDLFDDCILLYEGYQIYTGPAHRAKDFFVRMGWKCPARQTTADFLTSLTNPAERTARKGYEREVPRTAKEFYDYWRASPEYASLVTAVDDHIAHCQTHSVASEFAAAHHARQAKGTPKSSSFTASYPMQVRAILHRNWLRTKALPGFTLVTIIGNSVMALVLSSLFFNLQANTGNFFTVGGALFFAVLFNCFSCILEIMALFEARPIVEKHKQYALYSPSADAIASIISELPVKIIVALAFNTIYYFMIHFRRDAGAFFFYLLMCFMGTLFMSHLFRTIGAIYSSLAASMTPASVALLIIALYTGFAVPTTKMHKWSRWIAYINPAAYVFEALMANELHDRNYPCSVMVPSGAPYANFSVANRACQSVGAIPGQAFVDGDRFLSVGYEYYWSHAWRNFGIVLGFAIFFLITYFVACDMNQGAMMRGERALFPRSKLAKIRKAKRRAKLDVETGGEDAVVAALSASQAVADADLEKISAGTDIFHWRGVCYDVQVAKETRRILNHVDGWIKPGTLTALMGASGAGKTTLLDVLASRVTMGKIYGHMFVNGHHRDTSFQRSTGYAQQQDLHMTTTTVREALRFAAYLRQPASVSNAEKDAYVESVINILEMDAYADAVVGVPGEGLNVEQRKRLTIGVELAARPKLLLFLDEPTSGLDSQTAWSVCKLMRKLADNGQAILCTIHQPSALLFQEFDRLLFLAKGGRTVYFGDIGDNCETLIDYFVSHGAHECPPDANPAEWMFEVIGAAPGSHADQDYHQVWLDSKQRHQVQKELARMETELSLIARDTSNEAKREFAASFVAQYWYVLKRTMEYYYRSPVYIWSKIFLTVLSALFNGFTFYNAGNSQQGLQNQMLSVFMFVTIMQPLVEQMVPIFMYQRTLYEARERPSKTFSWLAWVLAQISAEIPYHLALGTLAYLMWFYPVGFYNNMTATNAVAERSALTWLIMTTFYMFITTYGQMWSAAFDVAEVGTNISFLCFTMAFSFCGVLKLPTGFWTWMYHVSPFRWMIQGVLSTTLGNSKVVCSSTEFVQIVPPANFTCGEYLQPYASAAGGYLSNTSATDLCHYCSVSSTNTFLTQVVHSDFSNRWRDWGIFFCYIFINMFLCVFLYWLARVPKGDRKVHEQAEDDSSSDSIATSKAMLNETELYEISSQKTEF